MNSLNLRLSSVKTGENVKKNSEMRAALVQLPKQYDTSQETYCVDIKNAKTVPEQVNSIKNTFKGAGLDERSLQFLCDLYFVSPLKHPVRNQILKLLITGARLGTGNLDDTMIIKCLTNSVRQVVEEGKTYTESIKWNATIASISGCFENFECGLKALEQCLDITFPFACASMHKYITELGVLNSPSVRNEYYVYVHNSIRFMLCCVQEFGQLLKTLHTDQLKQLDLSCKEIILDKEFPMDPRKNAGILMAHLAKLFDNFQLFISSAKDTKNPNEIVLAVGVINTCDQQDFQQYSADIRDLCSKIEEIANSYATVPNILLCATRALNQISKLSLNFALKSPNTLDDVKLILRKLLIFTVAFLEHHVDSVRHLCRDILRNIVAAAKKVQFDFLLQKIYDACNSERLSLSVKCVVLQQVAAILGAEEIISNCLKLFSELFAANLGRDYIVNNLFETLMLAHHKEMPFDNWVKIWINYLLNIASTQDARLPDIETLIVKAVKCEPRIVETIVGGEEKLKIPISTKLSVLWAVRKSGIKCENFVKIMQKFSKHLQLCVLSNCDETRLMALRLLVETHKTTEPLTLLECKHLITYLEYNANCQNTANRQKSFALLSKALVRCELNLVKLLKGKQPTKVVQNQPLEMKFLQDVMRILVSNLFPGANFGRRSLSLQLLEQCLRIGINCNLKLLTHLPKTTVESLIYILDDSYEMNKEIAVSMLKLLEDNADCSLIKTHELNINLDNIQSQLTSLRPKDSITAAYQFDFLCHKASASLFGDYELPEYESVMYAALKWLLIDLKLGLKRAKQNILEAAKFNPLYGLLFAIRHLMKSLDFACLAQEISWRILIAELIVLCKELTSVVAPIVNNSSPEGHMPNDFSDVPPNIKKEESSEQIKRRAKEEERGAVKKSNCKILSTKINKIDLESVKTTSQMVLLCAWRTVKEVSLILGEIILYSPVQLSKLTESFLITKEQILEIGEHFKQLLAEIKHRGAFEQVYVGFSKLCCRLWTIECLDLNALPMLWLKEFIGFLCRDEQINDKVCATRRSAGMPFMVQALIISELKLGTTKSLHYCMSHLLMLCSAAEKSCDSRTHALNILRALFRCADLNEAVGEFISDGVMVAINSYDSVNWSEKNSATLLFAALIIRIFGVQRNRDSENLNIRNKMTGRIFFLRYPKLYDYFLEQLQTAAKLVEQHQRARKLYPLLLIMSRLYPSALEGTESNLKLSAFLPLISKCEASPEMQTRQLAAKAIVALISKDEVQTMILTKCAEIVLMCMEKFNELLLNKLHGNLIQILYLIKNYKSLVTTELIGDITATIVSFHECTNLNNFVILKVMLDIFIEILNSLNSLDMDYNVVEQLLYFSNLKVLEARTAEDYWILNKSYIIYSLHIEMAFYKVTSSDDTTMFTLNSPLLMQQPTQQVDTLLSVILLILLQEHITVYNDGANNAELEDNYEIGQLLEECEIEDMEIRFVKALSRDTLNKVATELRQGEFLHVLVKEAVKLRGEYSFGSGTMFLTKMRSYAVLSLLKNFDISLTQLIKNSKRYLGEIKLPIMLCVERAIGLQAREYKCAYSCLEYLTEVAQPWQPDCLRIKVAGILSMIAMHYPKAVEKKRLTFVRPFNNLIFSLLMDDEPEVRDLTSKVVLNNLPDDIELGLSQFHYNNVISGDIKIPIRTESIVPTMAQRLFLQHTSDILLARRLDDSYVINVFKSIVTSLSSHVKRNSNNITNTTTTASTTTTTCGATTKDDDDDDEDSFSSSGGNSASSMSCDVEVFQKNETNLFAEPTKTIYDAAVVFKNTFKTRLKVTRFVDNFMEDFNNQRKTL